jgi:hypothetical protein
LNTDEGRNLKEMQRKIFSFLPTAVAIILLLIGTAAAQQQFTASMNPLQENPPTASNGRGNCLVTLNVAQTQITTIVCTYSQLTSGVTDAHIHCCAPPGTNAGVLFPLTPTLGTTSGTFTRGPFPLTAAQLADLRAKRMYVNIHTSNFTGGEIRGQIKIQTTPYDNDGDGRTDIKVYRSSTFTTFGIFSINNSFFSNLFGFTGETPAPGFSASDDYDGDGRGDLVLFRASGGVIVWRILQTGSNTVREVFWGSNATDDIVPADYDGDGKTDLAVYRFSTGIWYILQSSNNQPRYEFWGQPGANEFGMVGDFDRDGRNDLTTVRGTANGVGWFTRRSSDNVMQITYWGGTSAPASDFIFPQVQIDVDADGIQDKMVIRDPNGGSTDGAQVTVLVLRSSDNGHFILPFGLDSDDPFFGDYDGDGRTDFASRRNEGGTLVWYIALSSNNWNTAQPRVVRFGQTGDLLAGEPDDYDSPIRYEIKD